MDNLMDYLSIVLPTGIISKLAAELAQVILENTFFKITGKDSPPSNLKITSKITQNFADRMDRNLEMVI
jgi:hypothetical protein